MLISPTNLIFRVKIVLNFAHANMASKQKIVYQPPFMKKVYVRKHKSIAKIGHDARL